MSDGWITAKATRKKTLIGQNVSKQAWQYILIAVVAVVYVATWILVWYFLYNLNLAKIQSGLLLGALPAMLTAAGGLFLYKKKYPTPKVSGIIYITLILGSVAIPGITYVLAPDLYTIAPPSDGEVPLGTGNATAYITNVDFSNITGFCEVQLWQTYNRTNSSTWTQVNIARNWTGTEFYHNGWLNAYFFNHNLTGVDDQGRNLAYYLKVRPWWLHQEWMTGSYIPPTWWIWGQLAFTPDPNATDPYMDENGTSFTQARIGSGINEIMLVGEPYATYLNMENSNTLQDWDSSDDAYGDNTTANYHIRINVPTNESRRGYNTQYDWKTGQYYGIWLIASSDDYHNINHSYTDIHGNDQLTWFTITQGFVYKGVIFNDTLTSWGTYDVAILLEGFAGNTDFYADITIWNGTAGINWFLGKGFESDIQIVATL